MTLLSPLRRQPSQRTLAQATVTRLPLYLRALSDLRTQGKRTVSSDQMADVVGVNSANVRRDLSQLGTLGRRGIGYDVEGLERAIAARIGVLAERSVILVGAGSFGTALAGFPGFLARGFRIRSVVDEDPATWGRVVGPAIVRPVDELPRIVAELVDPVALLAVHPDSAQRAVDWLVSAGVTSILTFSPTALSVPEGVRVRSVDVAVELQILCLLSRVDTGQLLEVPADLPATTAAEPGSDAVDAGPPDARAAAAEPSAPAGDPTVPEGDQGLPGGEDRDGDPPREPAPDATQ